MHELLKLVYELLFHYSSLLDRPYCTHGILDGLAHQTKSGMWERVKVKVSVQSRAWLHMLQASSTMDSVCALSLHHQNRPGCVWPVLDFLEEAVRYT